MSNWVDGELLTEKIKLARTKEVEKLKVPSSPYLDWTVQLHPCKQLSIFFLGSGQSQVWILRFVIICIDGLESYSHQCEVGGRKGAQDWAQKVGAIEVGTSDVCHFKKGMFKQEGILILGNKGW